MLLKTNQSQKISLQPLIEACKEEWTNIVISHVNDSLVRLGVIKGEYHWHKHEEEDEFFFVVDGKLYLDIEDRTIELSPKDCYTVPKGIIHRTRASETTVILMVEKDSITPEGN